MPFFCPVIFRGAADAFAKASAEMDAIAGGWDVLTKADEAATKLRVRHLLDQPLDKLSGGERKRVALAAAILQEPDVILLDEPTNFLSLAGVQWLADLLKDNKKLTILMVTHDRAFLDDVCDRILELEQGKLVSIDAFSIPTCIHLSDFLLLRLKYEYSGSYADFLQGKEERLALEDSAVQTAKAKYRLELEWMRRQPQARQTKSKSRIDAFYKLQKATKPRTKDESLILESGGNRRIGGKILSVRGVNLQFDDKVILKDFSYDFCRGDRICLAGANGVGKVGWSNRCCFLPFFSWVRLLPPFLVDFVAENLPLYTELFLLAPALRFCCYPQLFARVFWRLRLHIACYIFFNASCFFNCRHHLYGS